MLCNISLIYGLALCWNNVLLIHFFKYLTLYFPFVRFCSQFIWTCRRYSTLEWWISCHFPIVCFDFVGLAQAAKTYEAATVSGEFLWSKWIRHRCIRLLPDGPKVQVRSVPKLVVVLYYIIEEVIWSLSLGFCYVMELWLP